MGPQTQTFFVCFVISLGGEEHVQVHVWRGTSRARSEIDKKVLVRTSVRTNVYVFGNTWGCCFVVGCTWVHPHSYIFWFGVFWGGWCVVLYATRRARTPTKTDSCTCLCTRGGAVACCGVYVGTPTFLFLWIWSGWCIVARATRRARTHKKKIRVSRSLTRDTPFARRWSPPEREIRR